MAVVVTPVEGVEQLHPRRPAVTSTWHSPRAHLCSWRPRAAQALTPPSVSVCLQCSIQRSAFDRCASLSQSGGAFPLASGPNLTLLVRQLLFFYRQNEDSKRLVSVDCAFSNPCVRVLQLLVHWQTPLQHGCPCEPPRSVVMGCLCDHVFFLLKLIQIFCRLFHFF